MELKLERWEMKLLAISSSKDKAHVGYEFLFKQLEASSEAKLDKDYAKLLLTLSANNFGNCWDYS